MSVSPHRLDRHDARTCRHDISARPPGRHAPPAHLLGAADAVAMGLLFALALALRLHDLGGLSLWVDEGASVAFTRASWGELWGSVPLRETNPSGYYSVLKLWIAAFGISDDSVRMPSAIASAACILPLYALVARPCGRRAAVAVCALVALSATQIQYAQEARTFALMAFVFLLALWTGQRAADEAAGGGQPTPDRPDRRWPAWGWGAGFVASCAVLSYLHHTAFLAVAAAFVYLIALLALRGALGLAALKALVVAGLAVFALSAPALYWILVHMTAATTHVDWIPQVGPREAYRTYRSVFGHDFLPHTARLADGAGLLQWLASPSTLADATLGLVCAAGVVLAVRRRAHAVLAALAALAWVMLAYFLFSQIQPILLPRVVVFATPLVAILAGYALAALRPAWLASLAAALLLALHAADTGRYFATAQKEPWRDMITAAEALHEPGTAIVVAGGGISVPLLVEIYWPGFREQVGPLGLYEPPQEDAFGFVPDVAVAQRDIPPEEPCRGLSEADRIILLERRAPLPELDALRSRAHEGLRRTGAVLIEDRAFDPQLGMTVWSGLDCQ